MPSGQRLNDSPIRASSESWPANSLSGLGPLAGFVEPQASAQVDRLAVDADAEVERERRRSRADAAAPPPRRVAGLVARGRRDPGDGSSDDERERGDDRA